MAKKKKLCEGDVKKIIDMYKRGLTMEDVAKAFSICKSTLAKFQKVFGIHAKDFLEERIPYNIHVFDNINTEEKAYWLGFLMADGYVNEKHSVIALDLSSRDVNHLRKFKHFMSDSRDDSVIKIVQRKSFDGNSVYNKCTYRLHNPHLKESLVNLGCTSGKSLTLKFPKLEVFKEPSLVYDFIRGYVDGDGSLFQNKRNQVGLSIVGTKEFLEKVKIIFPEFCKISSASGGKVYQIMSNGKKAKIIANKLYGHATIYLDRKFEKFTALFKYKDSETSGNIGEVCDDNTEIIGEITKGSSTS